MPIIRTDLPENALVNLRNEVRLYFGDTNKTDDRLIDSMIDDQVKEIHRRWHPTWTITTSDDVVAFGTGVLILPINFKKLLAITSRELKPLTIHKHGNDYTMRPFNTQSPPRREVQFKVAPASVDLEVRTHYFRRPARAVGDTSLVDIEEENVDMIRLGCRADVEAQKGNLAEYDRFRLKFTEKLQDFVDDDTQPDFENFTLPLTSSGQITNVRDGELEDLTRQSVLRRET